MLLFYFYFVGLCPSQQGVFLRSFLKWGKNISIPSSLIILTPLHILISLAEHVATRALGGSGLHVCVRSVSAHTLTVLLAALSQDKLLRNNSFPFHEHWESLTTSFLQILSSTWHIVTLYLHSLIEISQWTKAVAESA